MRISDWSSDVCSSDLEATIAAAVDADLAALGLLVGNQPVDAIAIIVQLGMAHLPVDRGPPVAAIAGRTAVIHVQHDIAALHQQVVEHLLTEIVGVARSEEHTSELQSLMRISYAVFCLKKKTHKV